MKKTVRFLMLSVLALVLCAGLIACGHSDDEHVAKDTWESNETDHWHACTDDCKDAQLDKEAHVFTNECDADCNVCGYARTPAAHVYHNDCDTDCNVCGVSRTVSHAYGTALTWDEETHWIACTACGAKKDEATHVYDKTVAASKYLKEAATATTKAQYWKSCVCGKASATEYFESDKTVATLANIQDLSKTYDKVALADPTYETNSDGVVTIEWYQGTTKLPAKPVNAGTYKVKVIVAESATYQGVSAEKEFTIAKKVISDLEASFVYNGSAVQTSSALGTANGVVAGDNDVVVKVTFESKDAHADVTGAVLESTSGAHNNYELNLATCTASILPKALTLPTLSKDYDGSNAVSYAFTAANGLVSGDSCTLTFNVTETAVGYYEDAAMTDIALTNANYKIEVSTCDLRILDANAPILLITSKHHIDGDFIIAVDVMQGTVRPGDSIVLLGTTDKVYEILTIEKFGNPVEFATVGDAVGLYVSGMTDIAEVSGGTFLYELNNVPEMATEFLAEVYMKPTDEGGRTTPLINNPSNPYSPNMTGLGASQEVTVLLVDVYNSEDDDVLSPGGTALVKITLTTPLPACLLETATFNLYEGTKHVGTAENGEPIAYGSFTAALVVNCDTAHSETMEVYAGQKVYVKMELHEIDTQQEEETVLSTFTIKATTGSAATFTGETYYNNTTTTYETVTTATTTMSMADLTCWEDGDYFYYVITCVTAGEISIIVE